MIICDHPSLFTQCCQRTSHVISLAKSSIKSGQRRSGPGNLSRKARQNFFFPYQTRDKPPTASQRGERLPTPVCTKLYIASVHNRHLHWSHENPWESQTSPWRHSTSHLLSLPKPCWVPARRHLRFMISGIKNYLEQLLLQKIYSFHI